MAGANPPTGRGAYIRVYNAAVAFQPTRRTQRDGHLPDPRQGTTRPGALRLVRRPGGAAAGQRRDDARRADRGPGGAAWGADAHPRFGPPLAGRDPRGEPRNAVAPHAPLPPLVSWITRELLQKERRRMTMHKLVTRNRLFALDGAIFLPVGLIMLVAPSPE